MSYLHCNYSMKNKKLLREMSSFPHCGNRTRKELNFYFQDDKVENVLKLEDSNVELSETTTSFLVHMIMCAAFDNCIL